MARPTRWALTAEHAAAHAGTWFTGPPLVLIGLTVRWLQRRGISPPPFLVWTVGLWNVLDAVVLGPLPGQWLVLALATVLLLVGTRRARSRPPAR